MSALAILIIPLSAQVSSDVLSYYPLNTGNYWEYKEVISGFDGNEYINEEYNYSLEVVGDTLLPNNKIYKKIAVTNLDTSIGTGFRYERIDSSTGNVYRYDDHNSLPDNECYIDSLMSEMGDTSRATRYTCGVGIENGMTGCLSATQDSLFGEIYAIKQFADFGAIPATYYTLCQGLGLVRSMSVEFVGTTTELHFARINGVEYGTRMSVKQNRNLPDTYTLSQNFPNPFNPVTTIQYQLPEESHVQLTIINLSGEVVATPVNQIQSSGNKIVHFDASDLASGVYFYRLSVGSHVETHKMILLK